MTLQEEMIRFRAKNKLSQTDACKIANITLQTWNQIELGNQKPSRMTESKIRQVIEKDLKSCPFCGGEAMLVKHDFADLTPTYGIKCKKCGSQSFQFYGDEETAIESWNRRKEENEQ